MKKYYLDRRVFVTGKKSKINNDNPFNLQSYILTTINGSDTSTEPLTFSNALTKTADNEVKLGGALTGSTTVNKGSYYFRTLGAGDNQFRTIDAGLDTMLWTTTNSVIMSATDNNTGDYSSITANITGNINLITSSGIINMDGLPTYANELAAIAGGLASGDVYKTAGGELRIKL